MYTQIKIIQLITLVILCSSCSGKRTKSEGDTKKASELEVVVPAFQSIIDSAEVKGSIVLYDLNEDTYYSNDYQWAKKGNLPASTFKITNSIIALELGVVENEQTLFSWNGSKRRLKVWEQDLTFKEAFHYSCVPCYQEIARKIGTKRMLEYLKKLNYGTMKVDTTTIDSFWLQGESKITQFQQIDFLKRFYQYELPITQNTASIMKKMMVLEDVSNYTLSGKTGWSIINGKNNGWFVGYIETQKNTYFFATNVEPNQQFDMDLFPNIRKEVTLKAFKQMNIID